MELQLMNEKLRPLTTAAGGSPNSSVVSTRDSKVTVLRAISVYCVRFGRVQHSAHKGSELCAGVLSDDGRRR